MAQIDDGGSGGRRVNVDVNLIPFIDLMSVCIIFLLITAVWTQVSMIQIGSSIYGQASGEATLAKSDSVMFTLEVNQNGYVTAIAGKRIFFQKVKGDYDDVRLLTYLKQLKKTYPRKNDVIIQVENRLKFDHLIRGMDLLLLGGFPEIAVATSTGTEG
jgi:biopolymer transport protein TolR